MAVNQDHEFVRYVQRMVGPEAYYQALCSCGWRSPVVHISRGATWNDWNAHRYTEAAEMQAGLKQAPTGQEP